MHIHISPSIAQHLIHQLSKSDTKDKHPELKRYSFPPILCILIFILSHLKIHISIPKLEFLLFNSKYPYHILLKQTRFLLNVIISLTYSDHKPRDITFFTIADLTYCGWYIMKVMSIMDSSESDVVSIMLLYFT